MLGREKSEGKVLHVAIAAGGTGGHIMPGIALAQALQNVGRPVEVAYFCGNRQVELDLYHKAGLTPCVFPVGSMSASGSVGRIFQSIGLFYTFLRSLWVIRRFDVVVGMGGYISGPVLMAARLLRIPYILHDSNTVLGRVNRMMGPKASVLALGLPLVELPENIPEEIVVEIGTPVRREIPRGNRVEAAGTMYFKTDAFTILIQGGSQGARSMNELLARTLGKLSPLWPDTLALQILWLTGPDNLEQVREALRDKSLKGRIWLAPSMDRMDHAYAMADMVISRSGGSSIAEILSCQLPSILIPLPNSKEQHQRHNAASIRRKKAAWVADQEEVGPKELAEKILTLATDKDKYMELSDGARRQGCPDAARDLARIVTEVATGQRLAGGSPQI